MPAGVPSYEERTFGEGPPGEGMFSSLHGISMAP